MFDNNIRNFIVISFFSILLSRIIPHPPNFTTTITVAFYLPALFGLRYLIVTLIAFILSDIILGIHNLIFFTWGSIVLIGLFSKYFNNYYLRLIGVAGSCIIFFLISNFGFWLSSNMYSNDLPGLITCYVMGLPFLQNSFLSSIMIAIFIELIITMKFSKLYISKINEKFLH
ncbi:hypothetical protein OA264_02775 [Alphaproteobacteria bacterium]|nr:hypothetical protein [Alphaproteobacteria bacterium]